MSGIWKGGKRIYLLLNLKTFFNIKVWNKAWIPPYNARSGSSLNSDWQKKSIFPPIPQLVGNLHCVTQETAKTENTLDPLHLPLTTLQSFNWQFYSTPPNILLGGISVGWPLWTWNGWDGSHLSPSQTPTNQPSRFFWHIITSVPKRNEYKSWFCQFLGFWAKKWNFHLVLACFIWSPK